MTPPPQKRIKSADLYRAQHGISPTELEISTKEHDIQPLPPHHHHHHHQRERNSDRSRDNSMDMSRSRERDRSRESNRDRDHDRDRDRDRSLDLRESLLGQALEAGGPTLLVPTVNFSHNF